MLKASEQHLLFEDLDSAWPHYTGRFTVVNRDMQEVARFSLDTEGAHRQILLPPKIQLPPFDDEIALRVAGTGGCLALREEPGTDNPTRECLPDGERLILAEPDTPRDDSRPFHTSIGVAEAALWVHVRTEQGVEGWVSHDYLEHD